MNNGFIQQTARSIIGSIAWNQLNRVTLVLPSHRAGLVLKDEILRLQQEQRQSAIWAPQVTTLPQLQDSLSPLYEEDELMTVMRLYKKYVALNQPDSDELMPLDIFYGWGRQMLADFTNIDASMPAEEVPNFFENTIAAHMLEQWQLDEETETRLQLLIGEQNDAKPLPDSIKAQFELIWTHLYDLYTSLRADMVAEQKGYTGLRQREVITHWSDEIVQSKIAGRTYIFVGFNYLLPVERELMQLLKDAGQAQFYWDYVPDFQTNEKAFSFTRLNSTILGAQPLPVSQASSPIPVTLISCSSHEAQAQYVHSWLQKNYTEEGQKVGVVICDETMLEPVIYTLPAIKLEGKEEPQPINITKGFPLRNTAVYANVVAWLNDRKRGDAEASVTAGIIDELLAYLFPVKPTDEQSPISNDLSPLSWQELLILESEYQVRKIANQMRQVIETGLDGVPFTLRLLRLLMRRAMDSVTMPFHGEPVTDIQVMGVLETRLLDFDKLLLLSVEEGVLPQRQNDLSFIPYYLRKAYQMQTPDERATVYAYNFFRLLSRAGQTTILYSDAMDGSKGMSRFVMQILYSPEFEVKKASLYEPSIIAELPEPEDEREFHSWLSTMEVKNGVVIGPKGYQLVISPSQLNTFITCPRSFYRQYVLGKSTPQEDEAVFNPATLGSFVHHMMKILYTRYMNCTNDRAVSVTPEQIEAVRTDRAKMQTALEEAYVEMNKEAAKYRTDNPNPYVLEHHVGDNVYILGYVNHILERDREDAKEGLQIRLLEDYRKFPVNVKDTGKVNIGGYIDRLDIIGQEGNQRMRIVDYKTGAYNDKTTHAKKMASTMEELMENSDKGYVRQTLLYCHAAKEENELPIEPNLFYCSRPLVGAVTTIDVDAKAVHDYRAIEGDVMNALQTKLHHMLTTTDFPKCDEKDCPSYCAFFDLCGRKPKDY